MKKIILFIIISCFAVFAQGAAKVSSVNCNEKIKPSQDDAMAIAFICSPKTGKAMKPVDESIAASLNTILNHCSVKAGKAALHEQKVWLQRTRNPVSNYEDFFLQMEDRSENLALDADYASRSQNDGEYGCTYFERLAKKLRL